MLSAVFNRNESKGQRLKDTEGALCFICKEDTENTCHFFWIALSLNRQNKVMLLVAGLPLPFDNKTITLIKKFVSSSAVGKIRKLPPRNYLSWRHSGE